MSVTQRKTDHLRNQTDLERIDSVKKKLFTKQYDNGDEQITKTRKKSEREENVYTALLTCKGYRKADKEQLRVIKNVEDSGLDDDGNEEITKTSKKSEREENVYTALMTCKGKIKDYKEPFRVITNIKDSDPEPTDTLSRKRKRQPDNWQRNIIKRKREAGEQYTNIKGKKMAQKMVRPGCDKNCHYQCSIKFSHQKRDEIKKQFYSLTDDQKYKYYGEYTERKQAHRKRTQKENSRRKYSFFYYLPSITKEIVCKTFFCATLDISVNRVYHFYKKKGEQNVKIIPTPQKGRYVKKQTAPEKIEEVMKHIRSFPVVESHYCRASTKRQYLDPSLSITKMHSLYVETHREPVKENIYRKVFNEKFNFSFHSPKNDLCDTCCEYKAIKKPNDEDETKYKDHIIRKMEGNAERAKDRLIDSNTAVITFDLENIFSLPKANISCLYYTCKLTVYNLTGHCNVDNSATNAVWDETRNGRSGDDIASALTKILSAVVDTLPSDVTKLILWSDSCVPQNKNSHMSMAIILFLQSEKAKYITEIVQKFSEPGHGNVQEVDTVHSIIERNLKHQEIFSPLGLMRSLLKIKSKTKFRFMQMQDEDFHSYHEEAIKYGFSQIPYSKIKYIKYSKLPWNVVQYKTSFKGETKSVDIKTPKINILSEVMLKKPNNCLSDKKLHDIRFAFKYMPIEEKHYLEALFKKISKQDCPINAPKEKQKRTTKKEQNVKQIKKCVKKGKK